MKFSLAHAIAVAGTLAVTVADPVPTQAPTNSTPSHAGNMTVQEWCDWGGAPGSINNWYYNSVADGPHLCTNKNDDWGPWSMLNAYRSGGTEGVHWKYTDNPNDDDCLKYWTYYTSDGNTVIESQIKRTTFNGDTRRWCGLPVYRTGGVQGKQWDYCNWVCWG